MRFLLDEDVSPAIAPAMQALAEHGEEFRALADIAVGSTDDEVVALCHAQGFDVLVTLNVRDFGARLHYYSALQQRGIHVVVARPNRMQPDLPQQMALICAQFGAVRRFLQESSGPTLIKLTRTSATVRTLDELVREQEGLP